MQTHIESVLRSLDSSYHAKSIGSVDEIGFYALIHGSKYHFVIQETSQGFLYYEVYEDRNLAIEAWKHIEARYEEYYQDVCTECQITNPPITIDCNSCEYNFS